jgi:hypothetical protein
MAEPWDGFLRELGRLGPRPAPGQSGVEVEENHIPEFIAGLTALPSYSVLVGIPQDSPRPEGGIDNAALGYIHETGSPAQNIPARPFLRPGVLESQSQWLPYFEKAGQAALAGDLQGMKQNLARSGMVAAREVQAHIRAGIPPPLSPRTVARRRRRSTGSKYRRQAMTAADVTPLIDTGSLLRSITSVVEKESGDAS